MSNANDSTSTDSSPGTWIDYKYAVREGVLPDDPECVLSTIAAEYPRRLVGELLERAGAQDQAVQYRVVIAGLRAGLQAYRAELEKSLARTEKILAAAEALIANPNADASALPTGWDAVEHETVLPLEDFAVVVGQCIDAGEDLEHERFVELADETLETSDAELPAWKAMQLAMAAALQAELRRGSQGAEVIPIGVVAKRARSVA